MTEVMRVRAASTGWTGAPGLNTFYFHRDALVHSAQEAADLAVTRVTSAFDDAKAIYPTQWSVLIRAEVDFLEAETGQLQDTLSAPGNGAVTGTGGSGYGPLHTMLLLQLRTSTFNDGSRVAGRAYLGPMGGFNTAAGGPNSGMIDGGEAFADALMDTGVSGDPQLTVWRRPREARGGDHPLEQRDGLIADVLSISVASKWAVLTARRD